MHSTLARFLSCLAALVLVSTTAPAQTLVHYYNFATNTGNDQVGNANGVLSDGATISNGELQTTSGILSGLVLNGPSVTNSAVSGLTGSFSIEDWATITPNTHLTAPALFGFTSGSASNYFTVYSYHNLSGTPGTVDYDSPTTNQYSADFNGLPLPEGTPIDVGVTYSATTETLSLYLNGVETTSVSTDGALNLSSIAGTFDGGIGGFDPGLTSTAVSDTTQFAIYNGALSSNQMLADFDNGSPVSAPEPSTWAMLCGGMALLFLARRLIRFSA